MMAEGVGFEPTLGLLLSLISSQVPLTTQPPFHTFIIQLLNDGKRGLRVVLLMLQFDAVRMK